MIKKNKISYYSLEDLNKIGAVDNINCSAKSFLNIYVGLLPFILILLITNILPISTIISNILFVLISIIVFVFLFSIHVYDRFINFNLSIHGKEIIYKNERGEVFNYNVNDLVSATYHRKYSRSGLVGNRIEINMCDKQTIWINAYDRHFYKLMTYLEQKNLFKN